MLKYFKTTLLSVYFKQLIQWLCFLKWTQKNTYTDKKSQKKLKVQKTDIQRICFSNLLWVSQNKTKSLLLLVQTSNIKKKLFQFEKSSANKMAPVYGFPNYDFLDGSEEDVEKPVIGLSEVTLYYLAVLISLFLIWIIIFFCLRILTLRMYWNLNIVMLY